MPPTWSKAQYRGLLTNVWRKASDELAQARDIVIIGYSMPEHDEFFRHLLALSLAQPLLIDSILIVDKDVNVAKRLKQMVSANVEEKIRLINGFFGQQLERLRGEFGLN